MGKKQEIEKKFVVAVYEGLSADERIDLIVDHKFYFKVRLLGDYAIFKRTDFSAIFLKMGYEIIWRSR